jgi:hypothetical protein
MRKLALIALLIVSPPALAEPALTNQQIAVKIVQESREDYYATGHPCACPEDHARNGSRCGGRSAYSRPGGAMPKCYVSDVTAGEIEAYRKR